MFEQLPETTPQKNKRNFNAFGAALALQAVLVAVLITIQMAMPEKLGQFELISTLYMAPPLPPPPAAPVSAAPKQVQHAAPKTASVPESAPVVQPRPEPVQKEPEVMAPTTIPQDIARIAAASPPSGGVSGGVVGGVQGGVPGGVAGGALNGILGGAAASVPPPPPTEPVRVGGNVKEPKLVHMEQPQYPSAAKKSGVQGVVVVEATVTSEGSVDKVKVVSGSPLLADAAAQAVSHWKYEPTYLNGQAVPVILTAKITFSLSNAQS
jgi:periplasmic protein TonB